MAKLLCEIPLPDGSVVTKILPDHAVHTYAVAGLLKLKQRLPPLNPDDKNEEPRYRKLTRWILIGTTDTPSRAEQLTTRHGYADVQLESRIIRFEPKPILKKESEEDMENSEPVGAL